MTAATIKFTRLSQWADRKRAYQLFVNGRQVGEIKRKGELDVSVPVGDLVIEARIDWCQARPLSLTMRAGEHAEIEVSNTYGALKAAQAITTHKETYLTLARMK